MSEELKKCVLCADDPIERANASEHMEWLGDELDNTKEALREAEKWAKHWETQYRRLVAELVQIGKERFDDLPPIPTPDYGPPKLVNSAD